MNNERDIIMNTQPYAEDLGIDPSEGGDVGVQPLVHTPGPWRVYCDEARGRPRCLIVDKDDGEIASVNPHRTEWNVNADLIAAAPQLFQSLLHAMTLLRVAGFELDGTATEKMKEAIELATGQPYKVV